MPAIVFSLLASVKLMSLAALSWMTRKTGLLPAAGADP